MVFLNTFIDHTSCRVLYRCRQLRKSSPVTATYLYSLNFFDWAKSGGGLKPSPSPCAVPVKTVPVWSVLVKYRTIFLTRTLTLSSLHSSWSIKSQSNITPERVIPAPARSLIEDYNNSSKSTKSLSLSLIEQFISPKDLFIQFSEDDFEVNLFIQLSYCIYYTKSLLESYQLDQLKYSPPPLVFIHPENRFNWNLNKKYILPMV